MFHISNNSISFGKDTDFYRWYHNLVFIISQKESDTSHYPQLPQSQVTRWDAKTIDEIFYHNTGKALNKSDSEGELYDYITTSNLYWNKFDLSSVRKMKFKSSEIEKCSVRKGDLLICEGGDVGRAAVWNYDFNIMIQTTYIDSDAG